MQSNHIFGSEVDMIWIPHLVFLDCPTRAFTQNDDASSLTVLRQGFKQCQKIKSVFLCKIASMTSIKMINSIFCYIIIYSTNKLQNYCKNSKAHGTLRHKSESLCITNEVVCGLTFCPLNWLLFEASLFGYFLTDLHKILPGKRKWALQRHCL